MKRNDRGFTLIELLIALTIFSLISVAIYTSFYIGIKTWRRNEEVLNVNQVTDYVFRTIRKDIGKIVNLSSGKFLGKEKEISFFILSNFRNEPELSNVKYFLKEGFLEQTLFRKVSLYNGGEEVEDELADSIENITFSYLGADGNWQNQWSGEEGLPMKIKINLSLKKRHAIVRTFFIPIGKTDRDVE